MTILKTIVGFRLTNTLCALAMSAFAIETQSGMMFYTNEESWKADLDYIETFSLTSENIGLAEELVADPTTNGQRLGSVLTFNLADTGLSSTFRIATEFDTAYVRPSGPRPSYIDVSDTSNDDFDVSLLTGTPVGALGIHLFGNDILTGERFEVYGEGGAFLGSTSITPGSPDPSQVGFLGVISDVAISRIFFDEDSGSDDIGIAGLSFGTLPTVPVPVPPSVALVGIGLASLGWSRRRK